MKQRDRKDSYNQDNYNQQYTTMNNNNKKRAKLIHIQILNTCGISQRKSFFMYSSLKTLNTEQSSYWNYMALWVLTKKKWTRTIYHIIHVSPSISIQVNANTELSPWTKHSYRPMSFNTMCVVILLIHLISVMLSVHLSVHLTTQSFALTTKTKTSEE